MNIVRETREKLGMTQTEMADELGKSLRTIAGWEAQKEITDEVLILACQRLQEMTGGKE